MTEAKALDLAAQAAGWLDWDDARQLAERGEIESIRAHAGTIMENATLKSENERLREALVQHIYSAEHDADPRKAVRDIIEWNQRLALDPAVSAEARALHTQGWNEAIEAALAEVITDKTIEQHGAHCCCATCELNTAEAGIRALTKENSDASSD